MEQQPEIVETESFILEVQGTPLPEECSAFLQILAEVVGAEHFESDM